MSKNRQIETLAVLLGASIGLNIAVISLERYRTRRLLQNLKDYAVVTDMALSAYNALKEADPEAARQIAFNAQFGFIMNQEQFNDRAAD